jgi:hypothetical protein
MATPASVAQISASMSSSSLRSEEEKRLQLIDQVCRAFQLRYALL